jgi:hypothetical protein
MLLTGFAVFCVMIPARVYSVIMVCQWGELVNSKPLFSKTILHIWFSRSKQCTPHNEFFSAALMQDNRFRVYVACLSMLPLKRLRLLILSRIETMYKQYQSV